MERFNFPHPEVPTLPIPKVDFKTPRIVGAIERLQQENLINEIDRLNYDIKLKKNEKNN